MAKVKFSPGLLLSIALALLVLRLNAPAHTLPISYLFVVTDVEYVHVELSFNPFELASFSELDTNQNARLDPAEVESQGGKIARLLLENLTLQVDGKKVSAENAGISSDPDSHHATLRAHYRVQASKAAITVESNLQKITSSSHFTQVNCLRGGQRQLAQLNSQSGKATFEPVASKQKAVKPTQISTSRETRKP